MSGPGIHRRLLIVAVVGGVLLGVGLRSREMFQPWSGLHKAWGGAMYGNIARNMLRYGPLETRLAPITNTGALVGPEEYTYYYHYPPLLVSMVAVSYRVFGVHEGSARLVPLVFSLLTLGLVFVFTRSFWGQRQALLAVAIATFLPVEVYYADHVDVYGPPAAFFSALAIAGYAWWYRARRTRDLLLCFGALLAGFLTAWYTYFAAGLLIVHALWLAPREERPARRVPLAFLVTGVLVFLAFLLHRRLLLSGGGAEVAGSLFEKLLARTAYLNLGIPTTEGLIPVGPLGFVRHLLYDLVRMFGPVTLLLVAAWFVRVGRSTLRRSLEPRDLFLIMLLGYGFLHGLAFPMLLPGHDFLSRCFSVGFAIAAALTLDAWYVALRARAPALARAGIAILLVLVTVPNARSANRIPDRSGTGQRLALWGEFVREATTPETLVLLAGREDEIFRYYLDREVVFNITTEEALEGAIEPGRPAVFVVGEEAVARLPSLDLLLDKQGAYPVWRGLRLYTVSFPVGGS